MEKTVGVRMWPCFGLDGKWSTDCIRHVDASYHTVMEHDNEVSEVTRVQTISLVVEPCQSFAKVPKDSVHKLFPKVVLHTSFQSFHVITERHIEILGELLWHPANDPEQLSSQFILPINLKSSREILSGLGALPGFICLMAFMYSWNGNIWQVTTVFLKRSSNVWVWSFRSRWKCSSKMHDLFCGEGLAIRSFQGTCRWHDGPKISLFPA